MALPYKCPSGGCYSFQSSATNTAIIALQNAINRLSAGYGFTPIGADGVFGKGSLAALLTALNLASGGLQVDQVTANTAGSFYEAINTPEDVMTYLPSGALTTLLIQIAGQIGAPAQVAPSKDPPNKLPVMTNPNALAALAAVKGAKAGVELSPLDYLRNLALWQQVAIGAVVIGGVAFVATKKKRTGQPAITGRYR